MKVLDMGSSLNPDIRATDAVEYDTNKRYLKKEEGYCISQALDLGLTKDDIKKLQSHRNRNIKIIFGINYNDRVPYRNNTFDLVVSHASMAMLGEIYAYKEAYRVLKRGGILEVGAAHLSDYDTGRVINHMTKSGFEIIAHKQKIQDTRLFFSNLKRMKNDVIYGVKV